MFKWLIGLLVSSKTIVNIIVGWLKELTLKTDNKVDDIAVIALEVFFNSLLDNKEIESSLKAFLIATGVALSEICAETPNQIDDEIIDIIKNILSQAEKNKKNNI